jgi:hypothetical protein
VSASSNGVAGTFASYPDNTIYVILGDTGNGSTNLIADDASYPSFAEAILAHEFTHVAQAAEATSSANWSTFTGMNITSLPTDYGLPALAFPSGVNPSLTISEIMAYGVESNVLLQAGQGATMPPGLGFSSWSSFNAWYNNNASLLQSYAYYILTKG